ncbi:ABC transporter permease [Lentilactobacillus sp. SPB1-3]|uniref:ABC transporter permease n=1 Tax=Lentilactobacillus terminaliae TaxID=3003483 RepID=A0ACD5DFQ5_9LACO|nr:ABC transporter permease [Lentilactobacillus sp. SPB1-3]MCZ0976641.1 ABC transporter permease [Lentilactobacillus sp. SPB1-3]
MLTLIHQEIFKLLKKKSTYWASIILILVVIGISFICKIYPKTFPGQMFFTSSFGSDSWVMFVMIAACASIISMEFQYGTIKEVIYQQYSRETVLISKWITMFLYSVYLYLLTGLAALVGKVLFLNNTFSITQIDKVSNGHITYLMQWFVSLGSSFVSLWLVLSVVFLFATLFKTSTMAVSVGIIAFFAFSAVSTLMFSVIAKHNWVKWNPFNFLNFANQIGDPARSTLTKLSDAQLFVGSILYTVLFLLIGLLSFRRKNV